MGAGLASNLTKFTDSGGKTEYEYDTVNEPIKATEPGGQATKFVYDGDHRLTEIAYASKASEKYTLDLATGRPEAITFEGLSGTSVPNLSYTYLEGANHVSYIKTAKESTGTGTTTTYSYDQLERLKEASAEGEHASKYVFELDGAGNRTKQEVKLGGASLETAYLSYNAANELECRQTVKPPCTGSSSTELSHYEYDLGGELKAIVPKLDTTGSTFAYNAASQTTAITPSGGSEQALSYAGSGQDDLVKLGSATLQNSTLGLTKEVATAGTSYFARTPTGLMIDERTPSGAFNPLYDAQGNIIALVNSTGKVERTFRYGPYGENTTSEGLQTIPYPFGYKGGYRTPGGNKGATSVANGLYHFGQRYYDPTTGRWTQQDPLSQRSNPVQGDRYSFAAFDPVNRADSNGRLSACGAAGTAIGTAAGAAAGNAPGAIIGATAGWLLGEACNEAIELHHEQEKEEEEEEASEEG